MDAHVRGYAGGGADGRDAADGAMDGVASPSAAVRDLMDGRLLGADGEPTHALLAVGAPRVGKTDFAIEALLAGLAAFGDGRAVMAVPNRLVARALSDRVVRRVGATSQSRPVTTLSAVAFRVIAARRDGAGLDGVRLLNGAEQDALLRKVVAVHIAHVRTGDGCATCALLRSYYAVHDWEVMVSQDSVHDGAAPFSAHGGGIGPRRGAGAPSSSEGTLARAVNDELIRQLRDMLARMDELGVGDGDEPRLLDAVQTASDGERLRVQWRLAFALRGEYRAMAAEMHAGQCWLDASRLLVEATHAVGDVDEGSLPDVVVVDDFQDMTLAGMSFVERLASRGTRVVLVGNPDESVQSFRGSYPEYLVARSSRSPLHAAIVPLGRSMPSAQGRVAQAMWRPGGSALRDVAARVSLSIGSVEEGLEAVPSRPWKMDAGVRDADGISGKDDTVGFALYRSGREELDDIVWRMKHAHLAEGRAWNDMALIAHDNATVRMFGERLRRDGVPVRYSSVTRPLRDEPFVRGLFALISLARMRGLSARSGGDRLSAVAHEAYRQVETLMDSPLITVGGGKHGAGVPVGITAARNAMQALVLLEKTVSDGEGDAGDGGGGPADSAKGVDNPVRQVDESWRRLRESWAEDVRRHALHEREASGVSVDDGLLHADDDGGDASLPLCAEAMVAMLAVNPEDADAVRRAIVAVGGADRRIRAFDALWDLVDKVAHGLRALPSQRPPYALDVAWRACAVAGPWQRLAFDNTEEGRAANDRLDAAMRLFAYAEGSGENDDIMGFIAQVRSMRIEADSLATVAPIDQAVTLTTPAGAAGRHWPVVWIPAMQQGVWPNLAPRNTLFGGGELADIMLHGSLPMTVRGSDPHLLSVLYAEQKAFLVALTRADERVCLSAALNDDMVPSDFLYSYMSPWCDRGSHADAQGRDYTQVRAKHGFAGLDADPRGIVAAARMVLATHDSASAESRDAAQALALLRDGGVRAADPDAWPFIHAVDAGEGADVGGAGATAYAGAAGSASVAQCPWGAEGRERGGVHGDHDSYGGSGKALGEAPVTVDAGMVDVVDGAVDGTAGRAAGGVSDIADGDAGSEAGSEIEIETEVETGAKSKRNLAPIPTCGRSARECASQGESAENPVCVALSPSAVDNLWGCPVCWLLEHRFSGPQSGGVAAGFGTLIHEVAQRASSEGLDMPKAVDTVGEEATIDAIAARMVAMYGEIRPDPQSIPHARERYAMLRKDGSAPDMLRHIAAYFVRSHDSRYPQGVRKGGKEGIVAGRLVRAECEREFAALFCLDDITEAFNAMNAHVTGDDATVSAPAPVSRGQMYALLEALVGGWPEAMREDMRIRLTGRIDRVETREMEDGSIRMRLIDYKTGKKPAVSEIFNDLQLVCYQLGLAFPEGEPRGARSVRDRPTIAQSALFHVAEHEAPAYSHAPESAFQPPLFVKGRINGSAYTPRTGYPSLERLSKLPPLPEQAPPGVGDALWKWVCAAHGSQTLWALTMIARVFHAAASSQSDRLLAHPTKSHLEHCRYRSVCPACAGQVDTVYEVRSL